MSRYWLRDTAGRVVGPAPIEAVRELIASGRLHDACAVSRDGAAWAPLSQLPELAEALATAAGAGTGEARADEIRRELAALRGRPLHAIVGVAEGSAPDVLRAAFLRRVKEFHPARLPPDATPAVRAASIEMFHFLGGLMTAAERGAGGSTPAPAGAASVPAAGAPAARGGPVRAYTPADFVGIERRIDDRVEVRLRVTLESAGMFSDHPIVNISRGGVFIATDQPPDLGSTIDLVMTVEDPAREIRTKARVAWSCAPGGRQPPGAGVSFTTITKDDLKFLEAFVAKAVALKKAAAAKK